jgi:uncharacterized protein GlcG (DUF336 family)
VLTTRRLDIEDARTILRGALLRSEEIGVPMCTAVVDDSGVLIAFERQDGSKVTAAKISIDKGFTAAAARRETAFFADDRNPISPSWRIKDTNDGHFSAIAGGIPVYVDGEIVGGVGVSGGTQAEDVDVAQAGIDNFLKESGLKAAKPEPA